MPGVLDRRSLSLSGKDQKLLAPAPHGKKDSRVISRWTFVHGLLFELSLKFTGNLLVPCLAHGLFDPGGVIYFRQAMKANPL
jgi:hypothetical protein